MEKQVLVTGGRRSSETQNWPGHPNRQSLVLLLVCQHMTMVLITLSSYDQGYGSGVEHLTTDQEVPGSNPGAPYPVLLLITKVGPGS